MTISANLTVFDPKSYEGIWEGTYTAYTTPTKFLVGFYEAGIRRVNNEIISRQSLTNDTSRQPIEYIKTSGYGQYTLDANGHMTQWESHFPGYPTVVYMVTEIILSDDQTTIASMKGTLGSIYKFTMVRSTLQAVD